MPPADSRFPWNDKYLDYEIETYIARHQQDRWDPWNDKYLDYEIETYFFTSFFRVRSAFSWNDKYLDYEIETRMCIGR